MRLFLVALFGGNFNGSRLFFGGSVLFVEELAGGDEPDHDAEDQRAGNRGKGDLTGVEHEVQGQSADARDQDRGDGEQVLVIAEVDLLQHLQTADGDEAVEREADAAHHAARNGGEQGDEGSDEGGDDREDRGAGDGPDRRVARDGDAADGLAVGGVRAAAEEGAHHRADAVAEQGLVQTRIGDQVTADDRGEVLVVGDVLREDHEGDRDIRDGDGAEVGGVHILEALEGVQEAEIGFPVHVLERVEVDDLQYFRVRGVADHGKDRGDDVADGDTDDERDQLDHLMIVDRADDDGEQGDQSDGEEDQSFVAGGGTVDNASRGAERIRNGVAGERKTDDRDGRADDRGGHQFIDPAGADELDDQRKPYVDETREDRADDQSEEAQSDRDGAGESRAHRAQKREGRSEEHGGTELGEELVNEGADARAEQSGGDRHLGGIDDHRNEDGRREDRKELLEREEQSLTVAHLLGGRVGVVNEFHIPLLFLFLIFLFRPFCKKKSPAFRQDRSWRRASRHPLIFPASRYRN